VPKGAKWRWKGWEFL